MAFKPNYNRDRAERDRAARTRSAEKLAKKQEKSAQRKALRDGTAPEPGTDQDTDDMRQRSRNTSRQPPIKRMDEYDGL